MMQSKRKVDLATTLTITTNYAGEFAGKYCGAALLSADTLDGNLVTIKPNVKYRETAKKMSVIDIIADAACDFNDIGTVDLSDRILEPKELQVNMELCKIPFKSDWDAISMGYSAHDVLPPTFVDFLLGQVGAYVGQATEQSIWHGVAATAGQFGGFVPAMTADAEVIDVVGAAGGITPANVVAELTAVYDAIPDTIFKNPSTGLYVANNVAKAYAQAMAALGYQQEFYDREKPLNFLGKPMWPVNGLQPSYVVAGEKENLWFGTGLMSDFNEIKVIDMAMIDGSQNVRFVMRYTAGTQYCIGAELVLYTPTP